MQDELMEFAARLDTDQRRAFAGLLDRLAERLEVDDDDEVEGYSLENLDLQNSLQRMQQNLTMMSNLSKMLHETNTAIIRNLG